MIVSCARLAGEPVVDSRGEEAGRIESVLLDLATGRVAGVVLACGGVLGLGERLCTVPWSQLSLDAERHRLVLQAPQEQRAHV